MACNLGFRIGLLLDQFFSDRRKKCYYFINTDKVNTISELKETLTFKFDLPSDVQLMHNGFLLLDEDTVFVIRQDETIELAGVVIFVIALWFVSWTPYAIVALLGILRQTEYLSPHVSMIPALFCKTASCADPYIYAITNPKFKRELCRLFDKSYQSKSKWSKQTGTTYRNKTPTSNKPVQTIEDTAHRTHYPSTFNSSSADD